MNPTPTTGILSGRIPFFASFLFRLYITGILIFMLLRLVLFFYTSDDQLELFNRITLKAFLIGFQFDSVALAYVLALPLLLLYINSLFPAKQKFLPTLTTLILTTALPALLFITIADIPYYKFFNNRISEASLQWLSNLDIVFKMIISNPENLILLVIAVVSTFLSGYLLFKYSRKQLYQETVKRAEEKRWQSFVVFLLLSIFCFLGMRGTIAHPIRSGDAFYCENATLNQLGLNPVFTLLTSYTGKVKLMDSELAIGHTQSILNIEPSGLHGSPIARQVQKAGNSIKCNVVLVLMESMSANYMASFGNKNNLTPTLDSLAGASWFFTNAYSAGIHTNNGIFSSLYSFPALRRIRPMSAVPMNTYSGMPFVLKENGYRNMFFSTHTASFDNLSGFLPHNFFDELYTAEDYPSKELIGPYGVPDDFLFRYASGLFDKADTSQPFFATILTTSNHDPYMLPESFKSPFKEKDMKAVSYADWSINNFLTRARTSRWYANTIFVFVADHGLKVGENPYDIPLSYNHIPLIIHSPKLLGAPQKYDNPVGQIDIFPTLMGLLNISYTNNTLGVDALGQKRSCIYFSADDKIGCVDGEWLYVYRFGGKESLYQYKTGSTRDYAGDKTDVFEKLRTYTLSQTQTAEWMIQNNKTSLQKPNP